MSGTHHATAAAPYGQGAPARLTAADVVHAVTGWRVNADDNPGVPGVPAPPTIPEVGCPTADGQTVLYAGKTIASYFWDDGSGINGDTGAPASGKPMQKGLAASPSWPMGTKGYVIYKGKKADFFIGDRGPGVPSSNGIMLDLDGKTFAELTGGTWNTRSLTVQDAGGLGHIPVKYVITEWGQGRGKTGAPKPFSTGAYGVRDHADPPPPCPITSSAPPAEPGARADATAKDNPAGDAPAAQALAAAAGLAPFPRTAPEEGASSAAQAAAGTATEAKAGTPGTEPKAAPGTEAKAGMVTTRTASPALSPASAAEGLPQGVVIPALSAAIVVCALVAVGVKAALRRTARAGDADATTTPRG